MAGDAPGDYEAAVKNHVYFYPICVGHKEDMERIRRGSGR